MKDMKQGCLSLIASILFISHHSLYSVSPKIDFKDLCFYLQWLASESKTLVQLLSKDVNKARGVKAKANKPRPRPETCKAKATDPKAKAKNANVNCRENDTVNLSILSHFCYPLEKTAIK